MTQSEKKMIEANTKLLDENNDLKNQLIRLRELIKEIKTYISVNKNENDKVNGETILNMIGDYYE